MEYSQVVSLPYGQRADSGTELDFSMDSDQEIGLSEIGSHGVGHREHDNSLAHQLDTKEEKRFVSEKSKHRVRNWDASSWSRRRRPWDLCNSQILELEASSRRHQTS